jgi:CubicO group peptidase (beta-lactamase class C family)
VLGLVLEAATGKALARYLSERIWQPLGMEADATWNTDRPGDEGVELSFCCLNARLHDYARFGRLMANGGVWRGRRILPAAFVAESVAPQRPFQRAGAIADTPFGYGYQWWLPAGDSGEFMAIGVYGQYLYVNPAADVVIVKTSADTGHHMHDTESLDWFRQVVVALSDGAPRLRTAAR